MVKYYAFVNRQMESGCFVFQYMIPLDGITTEESAVKFCKEIQKSLKDGYIVSVNKSEVKHIGFITEWMPSAQTR